MHGRSATRASQGKAKESPLQSLDSLPDELVAILRSIEDADAAAARRLESRG